MSTSNSPHCPRCGASIPPDAADQPCPACLMSGALAARGDETVPVAPVRSSAPIEPTDFPHPFGGYRLLGLLGRGGMGSVYDAEEIATSRRVALKMLGHGLDSPEMRRRFLREGRLAAGVSHPNSLYVFGSEEIDGIPVITMEIAGSGTLKDKLKKRGQLATTEAVDSILDVIAGLEAAFTGGVLHRDIKPSNCFVTPDGSVKIGDFGLSVSTMAKEDSYLTASGVIMGTPAYAAPEQLLGNDLDVRADIYSVGATLFTLLTGRAPFEGNNAVQVVANAVNQEPRPLSELREDVPPGLEKVVGRCLEKDPFGRYADYTALREALLPFSSMEPEPASMAARASAGWIDYLIAFLVPYVVLMLSVGNDQLHLGFIMERTLYSARHYIALLGFGFLYFTIAEGMGGAGFGKRLRGLRVVRTNGRPPGPGRALLRIFIPILAVEGIRLPVVMAFITATEINDMTVPHIVIYSVATSLCPMIPILLSLRARLENGFATVWDLVSGTRVVVKPKSTVRQAITPVAQLEGPVGGIDSLGPYKVTGEIVPGVWMAAVDPVLRRPVWLLRRNAEEPSPARRDLARPGRSRWLQKIETAEATWDAFEAIQGASLSSQVEHGKRVPWGTLRHWLHDLASELWAATGDGTLPAALSLDHVRITDQGRAVLLDEPWPEVQTTAERIRVEDVTGQQRFLHAVAAHAESTSLPLHTRPLLKNLKEGKFEKLSFLTGTLRGILDKPAEVSRGVRAGAIFMIPLYVWIMMFVGTLHGAEWLYEIVGKSASGIAMAVTLVVLMGGALIELAILPFRTTCGHAIFRLAVVNAAGEMASRSRLLARWAIIWLPLFLAMMFVALLWKINEGIAVISAINLLLLWIGGAVYAVVDRNRGLHDRLAGTWVVRR